MNGAGAPTRRPRSLGDFALLAECMNEACRRPVRKRIPHGKTDIEAECFECKATYTLVAHPGGVVEFKPKMALVGCRSEGCSERFPLWPHEPTPGTHWRCRCGSHNGTGLAAHKIELLISRAKPEADSNRNCETLAW